MDEKHYRYKRYDDDFKRNALDLSEKHYTSLVFIPTSARSPWPTSGFRFRRNRTRICSR